MRDQISSIESGYLLFKEKVTNDFVELEKKVKDLHVIVRRQNSEISLLKDENKRLNELCINYRSSKAPSPLGSSVSTKAADTALKAPSPLGLSVSTNPSCVASTTVSINDDYGDTEKNDSEPSTLKQLPGGSILRRNLIAMH